MACRLVGAKPLSEQCWNIVNWNLRNKLQWIFFIEIQIFSFKKMRLKVSSAEWRPFCLGLNVLNQMDLAHLIPSDSCTLLHSTFFCANLITVTSKSPTWRLKSPALDCLFQPKSKKISKPALLAICERNPPATGGFPSQRASNTQHFSME